MYLYINAAVSDENGKRKPRQFSFIRRNKRKLYVCKRHIYKDACKLPVTKNSALENGKIFENPRDFATTQSFVQHALYL